jgi:multicomponent K+:H+ antiporter subunit F
MIEPIADICLAALGVSMALCLFRLVRGPSLPDRALAMDTLAMNLIAVIVLLAIRYHTTAYFDAALVIAALGFIGTVAVSKYILKGDIID